MYLQFQNRKEIANMDTINPAADLKWLTAFKNDI
jgi:hypothetical protein